MRTSKASTWRKARALCGKFPEVAEVTTPTEACFRVGRESFAAIEEKGDSLYLSIRVEPEGEMAGPKRSPLDLQHHSSWPGWLTVRLDKDVDWTELEGMLLVAYVGVAPKKMLQALDRRLATP